MTARFATPDDLPPLSAAQLVGLEAIAAIKAHAYAYCAEPSFAAPHGREPTADDLEAERDALRMCLALRNPEPDDEDLTPANAALMDKMLRRDRDRLLHQAEWVGRAVLAAAPGA